jgi:hypothetical protein
MADGDTNDGGQGQPSGSQLRAQLETTISERDRYKAEVAQLKAEKVISTGGYELVSAEDLRGVEPENIEARAKALQDERAGIYRKGIESRFRQQGLTGEELDQAVEEFMTGQPEQNGVATSDEAAAYGRARNSGATGSQTAPPLVDPNTLSPQQKLELAFQQQATRRPRQ